NHMDALVYQKEHGCKPIYNEMSNAALHLWLAFNPDGSSRVNPFDRDPNPPYPPGESGADVTARHAVWDVDSEMPEELASFIAQTLRSTYAPPSSSSPRTGNEAV